MGTSRSSRRLIKVVFPDPFSPTKPTWSNLRLLDQNLHLCVHLNAQVDFAENRLVSAGIAETHLLDGDRNIDTGGRRSVTSFKLKIGPFKKSPSAKLNLTFLEFFDVMTMFNRNYYGKLLPVLFPGQEGC